MNLGEWCDIHDDWFSKGCLKCKDDTLRVAKNDFEEYDVIYERAKKESREKDKKLLKKFKYPRNKREDKSIAKWWSRMKNATWNPNYISIPKLAIYPSKK